MMNKSKGNMYVFVSHTWNTVKGECPHGCTYCYMTRFGKQNPVRFDESELRTNLGSGNYIFVGSSCDMFADDIPGVWIEKTLEHCGKFTNKYLFQTKNPKRLLDFELPESVVCTTIESDVVYDQIMANSPHPTERAKYMSILSGRGFETFVTIEPVMDFNLPDMINLIKECNPRQINVGSDSGGNGLPEPSKDKLLNLISELDKCTRIHKKSNLSRLL